MGKITLVVAMDKNNVIGKNGDIPWSGRLRSDMRHFKAYTMGKTVVMGRKTYDSIPSNFKPLTGRKNVVMTRNVDWKSDGCTVIHDIEGLKDISDSEEICVIGGAEIYFLFLSIAEKIILTVVDTEVENGDTFFPDVSSGWKTKTLSEHSADEVNQFSFTIFEYTR
jgi:dihydrofolate reductase